MGVIMEVLTRKQIKKEVVKAKKNKKIVFISGVFDLFHYGHFITLKRASQLGDILIVQIDGNKLVKRRKGPTRPYLSQKKRALIVNSLTFVSYVYISNNPSEDRSNLHMVKPDVFVRELRPDQTHADRRLREKTILKKYQNVKVVWMKKETRQMSTTKIVKVLENDAKTSKVGLNFPAKYVY